ncbi:MAG: CcoQ/FixQ family Cbb3-type cytochrome c oxidase assembly chaperone [Planctomycetes bacterium]|nr:CcoQ/FixQ family Cbb3-type cytochrome c oxidase assembly chaperone [Planctomycetota bacterium]
MLQEFYKTSEWLTLPLITLVFFFVFFVAVLIWVIFGMRNRHRLDRLARLPFDASASDQQGGPRRESNHG